MFAIAEHGTGNMLELCLMAATVVAIQRFTQTWSIFSSLNSMWISLLKLEVFFNVSFFYAAHHLHSNNIVLLFIKCTSVEHIPKTLLLCEYAFFWDQVFTILFACKKVSPNDTSTNLSPSWLYFLSGMQSNVYHSNFTLHNVAFPWDSIYFNYTWMRSVVWFGSHNRFTAKYCSGCTTRIGNMPLLRLNFCVTTLTRKKHVILHFKEQWIDHFHSM